MSVRQRLTPPDYSDCQRESELSETLKTPSAAGPDRPTTPPPPEPPLAARELLGFDPRLLADLPLATTLLCRRAHGGGPLVITTSLSAHAGAEASRVPAFVGGELCALTLAAEHDRGSPEVLEQWCTQKVEDAAGWRLSVRSALGEAFGAFPARGWNLGRVLRTYGLELVGITVGRDEVML